MGTDHSIVEKLFDPHSIDEFRDEYWENKVLHIARNEAGYYDEILTFDDVNEYLQRTDIRYPHIRLVNQGRELPLADYSYDYTYGENVFQGTIDMDKLFHIYNNGATISFQILQQSISKLSNFSNAMERFFKFPTQTNLFLTPPSSQGFTAHYDTHSFFVLHLYGSKTWRIYDDPYKLPLLRHREFDDRVDVSDRPMKEITLQPGDFMYVPRGVYHEALTGTDTALQITLGIFPFTWVDMFRKAVDDLADHEVSLRKAPAMNFGLSVQQFDFQDEFANLLEMIKASTCATSVFQNLQNKTLSKQIVDSKNRLLDLENMFRRKAGNRYRKRRIYVSSRIHENVLHLEFYDKRLELPLEFESEVKQILNVDSFVIEDLDSNFAPEDIKTLIELLVIEGLLTYDH